MRNGESHLTCTHNKKSIQNINSFVNQIMLVFTTLTQNEPRELTAFPPNRLPAVAGRGWVLGVVGVWGCGREETSGVSLSVQILSCISTPSRPLP